MALNRSNSADFTDVFRVYNYDTLADAPSPKQWFERNGVTPLWIGGAQYTSDGDSYSSGKYRLEPLRVAMFGDSTANISSSGFNPTNDPDMTVVTATSWQSGLINYQIQAEKYQLDKFYPGINVIFNGGISGETTQNMLVRESSGTSSISRRSIEATISSNPDVVVFSGGSINDISNVTPSTLDVTINSTYARHITIVERLTTAGIPVVDVGLLGTDSRRALSDLASTLSAILRLNAMFKLYAETHPLYTFVDLAGITHYADGKFISGMSHDGSHLSFAGQAAYAQAVAKSLTALFGSSPGIRYKGVNAVANSTFWNTITDASGTYPVGVVVTASIGTVTNRKIETINGKRFATAELTFTGANTVLINLPYTPQSMGIAVNDIYGFEYDFMWEWSGVTSLDITSMYARVDTRDSVGAGRVIVDNMSSSIAQALPAKFNAHSIFPPIQFGDVSANLTSASVFNLNMITSATTSGVLKIGVAMPRIVKLS